MLILSYIISYYHMADNPSFQTVAHSYSYSLYGVELRRSATSAPLRGYSGRAAFF